MAERRVARVLLAVVMTAPLGGLIASRAGAAAATGLRCSGLTATAHFRPALPVLSEGKKVASTVTSSGTLKHCNGGSVAGGTFAITYKLTGNCRTLLTYSPTPTTIRFTTIWNTNQRSTATVVLRAIKAEATKRTVTGTITSGLFTGSHLTTTFSFALVTKSGCLTTHLKELSVKGGPVVIK